MFALVIFTDHVLHVCPINDVSVQGDKCCVKYGKRHKYAARVLAVHAKTGVLGTIQRYIQKDTRKKLGKNPSIATLGTNNLLWADILAIRSANKKNVPAIYIDDVLLPILISSTAQDIFSIANADEKFFDTASQFIAADFTFSRIPKALDQEKKVEVKSENDSKDKTEKSVDANENVTTSNKISEERFTLKKDESPSIRLFNGEADKSIQVCEPTKILEVTEEENRKLQNFFLDPPALEVEVKNENDSKDKTEKNVDANENVTTSNNISEERFTLKKDESASNGLFNGEADKSIQVCEPTKILEVTEEENRKLQNFFLDPPALEVEVKNENDSKDKTEKNVDANENVTTSNNISEERFTLKKDKSASNGLFNGEADKSIQVCEPTKILEVTEEENRKLQNFFLDPPALEVAVKSLNDLKDETEKSIDTTENVAVSKTISEEVFTIKTEKSAGCGLLNGGADKNIQEYGLTEILGTTGESEYRELQNLTYTLDLGSLAGDISFTGDDMMMIPLDENVFGNVETAEKGSDHETRFEKPRIISDEIFRVPVLQLREQQEMKGKISDIMVQYPDSQSINFGDQPVMNSTAWESEIIEEANQSNDEDEEYIPAANSSDSDTNPSVQGTPEKKLKVSRKRSLNITLGLNKPGISAPDDANLMVGNSSSAPHLKRNFCFYCQKLQAKIARHLETVHAKEEDVQKFAQLPPSNKERKTIIAMLRKKGNHLFNNDKRFNNGQLLVCRRPNERMHKTAGDFIACGNCKGQYAKSVIRHHFRKCVQKKAGLERLAIVSGRKVTARLHEKANHLVRRYIFPYLREDAVVRGIRYDELMILYANKQCEKYGSHQHHFQMVRARLRLLGRFLVEIKKIKPAIKNFAECFVPRNYDASVEAVKIVADFNEEERRFAHPAVATNLGTLLKYCGEILRSEFIKDESDQNQKRVEDYLKLLEEGYGTSINRAAAETQAQNNRRKKIILPSTDDIKKFYDYLTAERIKHFESLNEKFSVSAWRKLAETTMLSLLIFNRRRPGEIERLHVEDFQHHQTIDSIANKDAYAALSEEGKKLARTYVRLEIRGKLGRGVPVLVHSTIFECLELLLQHRENAGISSKNPYLFALISNDADRYRYLRACNLMRKYSIESGAAIPNSLRATTLRKHLATHCLNLNLSNGQVTDLANFMGHEEKIHKDIYRQPVLQTDIVQMSNILKLAQGIEDESSCQSESGEEAVSDDDEGGRREAVSDRVQTDYHSSSPKNPRGWTSEQRNIVLNCFKSQLRSNRMPTGREMQKLIDKEKCLRNKNVPQIRSWLHNQKKKLG